MAEELPVREEAVPLTPDDHKNLKVKQDSDAGYLKENSIVRVNASEYNKAGNDYPIVFLKDPKAKQFNSFVLWGIENNENLFVKDDKWVGAYIPASVRCAPFTMARSAEKSDQLFIGIFPGSALLSSDEGEAIFNDDGTETQWMLKVKQFLVHVYEAELSTLAFLSKLDQMGLLVAQKLSFKEVDTDKSKSLDGFHIVDRSKLAELSDEDYLTLRKANMLEPIYAHLSSLENIEKLLNKRKQA